MLRLSNAIRRIALFRAFATPDIKTREKRAKLEDDPYDNPWADVENTKANSLSPLPVEPYPRRKLKELLLITLERLKEFPEDWGYRILVEETCRFRLKIVEENEDIEEIERKIGLGYCEGLIQSHVAELRLLEKCKHEKPWEPEVMDEGDKEFFENITNGQFGNWKPIFTVPKPPRGA
ncbi:unnamed protein product [Blepharisma stoltei]|uniref:NADH dehydrogenase [ubiquinone] 1 beta subcomplex subunit 5, mitochondrial n=1 Tax=Blepharisma stoltei TaxID=1481888 RepID=A0AAU9J1R2_9CILI|nr:unnamed protein product [Blepharisma stoltei]